VLYRHAYAAESLSHGMLPGLVIAALAGAPILLGAMGGAIAAAALIALAARDHRLGSDLSVAIAVTALVGAGALLGLAPDAPARFSELLFGDPLGVSPGDLAVAGAMALAVLGALLAGHRGLTLAAFDPGGAPSLGTRPGRAELGLLAVLGVAVVAAVQGLGSLLVLALLLAPGAAALRVTRRLAPALALAIALAAFAGVAGLYASYHLDIAAGAAIALAAVTLYALAAAARRPVGAATS
jgi:ABC-type Mn2+/Zn2+ transport system permease subunit